LSALAGGDASDNPTIPAEILDGERAGPRAAVVLNVACALVVAELASDLREGRERAEEALDRGDAKRTLERWRAHMRRP
jgi:anthranilate phosphoribosyltransferase